MSRMQINALTELVKSAEGGGYTLPTELTEAHRTYTKVREIEVTQTQTLELDTAAARVVSAIASGSDYDLDSLAREVTSAQHETQVYNQATTIVSAAVEQAASTAIYLATDLVERIITDHLAPALDTLYEEVREVAAALDGYGLDPHTLITAPAKARNAWGRLPDLLARRNGILAARDRTNAIGYRSATNDEMNLYATYRYPLTFDPDRTSTQRVSPVPYPEDRTEALLWIAADPASLAAKPWLPTIAQQDEAWLEQFGPEQAMRRQAHHNGLSVGSRG